LVIKSITLATISKHGLGVGKIPSSRGGRRGQQGAAV
jgi:hypothetical protein